MRFIDDELLDLDFLEGTLRLPMLDGLRLDVNELVWAVVAQFEFQKEHLPQLPAPWIASAVEAGYDDNPIVLHLEEYAIWKAPHSRTATVPVDDSEIATDVPLVP